MWSCCVSVAFKSTHPNNKAQIIYLCLNGLFVFSTKTSRGRILLTFLIILRITTATAFNHSTRDWLDLNFSPFQRRAGSQHTFHDACFDVINSWSNAIVLRSSQSSYPPADLPLRAWRTLCLFLPDFVFDKQRSHVALSCACLLVGTHLPGLLCAKFRTNS